MPHGHPHAPALARLQDPSVGLKPGHLLRTDDGEDSATRATEKNVGDDCYQFALDPNGIAKIRKWNVDLSRN